jgi:hypothetical protein
MQFLKLELYDQVYGTPVNPKPDFGVHRQAELPPTTITPTGKTP